MAFRRIHRFSRVLIGATLQSPELSPPASICLQTHKIPTSFTHNIGADFGRFRGLSSQAWVEVPTGGVVDVPLAQTGEGIAECELLKWFVQEGDQVDEFQRLCEVQSDKATIEITSRFKGKILQIHFVPGDIVKAANYSFNLFFLFIDVVIINTHPSQNTCLLAQCTPTKVGESLLKMLVDGTQTTFASEDDGNKALQIPERSESDSERGCASMQNKEVTGMGVLSTPAVRHLAKQYGLNINDIGGTGKEGRILKEDVLRYAASKGICVDFPTLPHTSATEQHQMKEGNINNVDVEDYEDRTVPLRGFQRSMVKSMTKAAKVPHFHYLEEINCDALMKLKTTFQNENTDQDVKHTFLPFLVKSLSMALNEYPLLNSSFNEETNEVIFKGCHNVGIAMATKYGLVVPNVKKVQSLSILEITKELSRLHKLASNNKLSTVDTAGGTITLSNIGAIGGKFGSPVLNLPEVAIIAIGRMQRLPRFADDGSLYPASVTNVTIGADHRIVDGATVAKFCNEWKLLIEKPELLLLHVR